MQGLRHPSKALTSVALLMGLALLAGALLVGSAQAVHDDHFELDGNVVVDSAGDNTPHDWSQVWAPGTYGPSGADVSVFVPDFFPGADNQPATGGTKADLDVTSWDCKSAVMSPPKNDIANAFAAKYGDFLYFGLDRINSDNGDATVGFWFFKGTHSCNAAVAGSNFTGHHEVGDVLIDSEFTGGGGVSTIKAYTWCADMSAVTPDLKCGDQNSTTVPPAGGGDGPLQLRASGADCRPPVASHVNVCATVNIEADPDVDPPWPYTGAAKPNNQIYENGALFEGGLNIANIGLDIGCGGTFLAYTRASQTVTAQMHDFALGDFSLCGARIKIEANDTNEVGTNHAFTVTAEKFGPSGNTFVAAPGVCVSATKTDSNGATSSFVAEGNDCNALNGTGDDCITDAAGTCTITITSPTSGKTTVKVSADIVIAGDHFLRDTDPATATISGYTPDSPPVVKTWVNAKISITPASDNNEVGTNHVLTCTIQINDGSGAGFVNAPNGTLCDADITGVGSFAGGDDDCLVDGGDGNCTITITSAVSGISTVVACTEETAPPGGLTVGGVLLSRCTDGATVETGHANSSSATKNWVNAKISLSPLSDLNPVGTNHELTCHIDINPGTGWVNAPAGTTCDADKTSGVGDFVGGIDSCTTIGATGSCIITITSNVKGVTNITACTAEDNTGGVVVGGVTLFRCTDGLPVEAGQSNSGPAVKTWGDAWITITPATDNNVVGTNHVLTVTVQKDIGGGTVPAVGACVTASIVSGPGSFVNDPADPDVDGCNNVDGNGDDCLTTAGGTCTITITSALSGTTVVHAATDIVIDGGSVHRETDGVAPNSGNASKTWVNAKISLTPGGTNFIYTNHPMTCHIEVNPGTGFVAASGATCDGNIDSGPGSFVGGDTCVTNASGNCTLTIVSTITGTTVVSACTSGLTVASQAITRCTDGAVVETGHSNSGTVTKIWISGQISFTKTFQAGPFTNVNGKTACFSLTRDPAPPPPISSDTDSDANAANGVTLCHTFVVADNGSFTYVWHNVVAGSHTITETTTPAGYDTMPAITGLVINAGTLNITRSFTDPLRPGDLRLRKLLGPSGAAWNGPDVTLYVCANSPLSSSAELPLTSCDSSQADGSPPEGRRVILTAAQSTVTVTGLVEGYYTVCEFPVPVGYTIPAADQCQVGTVVAGVTGASAFQLTFTNTPPTEGCTPGFWKNHLSLWDDPTDSFVVAIKNAVVAKGAPYSWNAAEGLDLQLFKNVFGLTDAQMTSAGLATNLTMVQAINLGGGDFQKLARHAVAGLLSSVDVNYTYSVNQVLTLVHNAVVSGNAEPTATNLANANNLDESHCGTPPATP